MVNGAYLMLKPPVDYGLIILNTNGHCDRGQAAVCEGLD